MRGLLGLIMGCLSSIQAIWAGISNNNRDKIVGTSMGNNDRIEEHQLLIEDRNEAMQIHDERSIVHIGGGAIPSSSSSSSLTDHDDVEKRISDTIGATAAAAQITRPVINDGRIGTAAAAIMRGREMECMTGEEFRERVDAFLARTKRRLRSEAKRAAAASTRSTNPADQSPQQ
jgi:hypothetical protein